MNDRWGQGVNRDRHEVIAGTTADGKVIYLCVEHRCGAAYFELSEVAQHVARTQWRLER